ncbi:helix-turn-helix domain-containing protein, partial [Saprospiraceae bacterium]|nr:helix-turn-helix domain-containing protein [Saprospiraceae bacterium]
ELKNELAGLLNISIGAVYKRINGTTAISLADLAMIMKHYNISFDTLVNPSAKNIMFKFPQLERKITSFFDYIQTLKNMVDTFAHVPDSQIYYATNELPFFYYFLDKDLTYFKFYIYAKTVWDISSYKDRTLRLDDFSEEHGVMNSVTDIMKIYYRSLPNIELWNENVLNNTLNQIKYFVSIGLFEIPEEAILLCNKLSTIMRHVEQMAKEGKKFFPGKEPEEYAPEFKLYYNEIAHTNNMLLIHTPIQSAVFSAYDNPNYIISSHQELVDYTLGWFNRVMDSSVPLSNDANKARTLFFNKLEKKIEHTRLEIQAILANR